MWPTHTSRTEPRPALLTAHFPRKFFARGTGSIEALSTLTGLNSLALDENQFSGEGLSSTHHQDCVNELHSRHFPHIFLCFFAGSVEFLSTLTGLTDLRLGHNKFSGECPPALRPTHPQECVVLADSCTCATSQLAGPIDALSACVALEELDLRNNNFEG